MFIPRNILAQLCVYSHHLLVSIIKESKIFLLIIKSSDLGSQKLAKSNTVIIVSLKSLCKNARYDIFVCPLKN